MRSTLLVLSLALGSSALAAAPTELKPKSRIDNVTVYRSTARVTRRVATELPNGDVRVVLEGLPPQLVDDSVRVQGSGNAKARVFGVTLETFQQEQAESEEVRALQKKLEDFQTQDEELASRIEIARQREAFILSLKSTYSEERTKNLAMRPVDTKELNAMAEFVAAQHALVAEQIRNATNAREELGRKSAVVQAELAKLQAKTRVQSKTLVVELQADKAGTFQLDVSYLVPSASWSPVYDARLDSAKGQVHLGLYASIQQSTGENWDDVKLAVSTAQPQRNLFVPELAPVYLQPQPAYAYNSGSRYPSAPSAPQMDMRTESIRTSSVKSSDEDEPEEQYVVQLPASSVAQGMLSTTLTTPRRESIDGSGKPRRAFLSSFALTTEMIRSTAPALDPQVFLTAKGVNASPLPILGGPASVFLDDEFLGRVSLPQTPVGGEIQLAFGADERVKVERKVERFHETSGVFSKDDIFRYRVRTTVKNLYGTAVTVTSLDQIPISQDESITVKVLEASTRPSEKEDPKKPGVRAYKLSLKPQQEAVIVLEYEVRAPKGKVVAGM